MVQGSGFMGLWVHGFMGSWFISSRVLGLRSSVVQGFRVLGVQRVSGFKV